MELKLMQREEIDDKRWNGCVHYAFNAIPYAYTWYLDNICETWCGIVGGAYKVVMPLVMDSKFGINYMYQPFFAQQLGAFSDVQVSPELMEQIMGLIPKSIKYIDISLNSSNPIPEGFETEKRDNFMLDLSRPYETISDGYSGNLLRNLKKAGRNELKLKKDLKPEKLVDFYMKNTAPMVPNFEKRHEYSMLRLIYKSLHYSMGSAVGVYQNDELVAANFFLFHPQRTINLLPSSNETGRSTSAMAFLIDTTIQMSAGQKRYLDFEGSMIEGVAKFYKSFGSEKTQYLRVKRNDLPWLVRLFKK